MTIDTLLTKLSDGDNLHKEAFIRIKILQKMIQILKDTTLGTNLCPDHRDKIRNESCLMCQVEYLKRLKI